MRSQVKTEAAAEAEGSTGELQQTLNEREEQIKANEEKIKDLQVHTDITCMCSVKLITVL